MKQSFSFGAVTTHPELLRKLSMLFLIILLTGTLMSKVNGQAIYVDKVDYMPGDEVKINGYAWRPGELVSVILTENYLHPEGQLVTTKSFTCDFQGKFTGILYTVVEANLGAFFQAKATGSITSHVCTTVFHDAGGDYSIDYSAYDPQFYLRRTVAAFPSGYFPLEGNHISPLGSGGTAGFTMHTRTVESLSPQFLGLGQIVAFEFYISADASGACINDKISFGGEWSTVTQNSGNFGFDPAYMVIAAFVDPSTETNYLDGGTQANVRIISNEVNGSNIEAMFEVSGLDPGDKFPVEVWLVLKSSIAVSVGSNVPTGTIDGLTLGTCEAGDVVKMGKQTIPLLQAGDFYTTDVDILINKTDSQDPVGIGSEFYYTLSVTNNGPSVANDIVITDILSSSFDVNVDAIIFSHDIYTGYTDDALWENTFDILSHTLTLSKLSIDIGETIYIRVPVSWISPYTGTKTAGAAGPGAAGTTCTGDIINQVSITTISDDINSSNNSYCQPSNVYCSTVTAIAGPDKELTCIVTSVILEGSASSIAVDYLWVASNGGNIVSGVNSATPVVNTAGTYTLTVTDQASGCTATDFTLVTLDDAAPDVEAGEAKILTCSIASIALAGSSTTEGATFSWSGPGIVSGGTTLTPTVNAAGTYILTVTAPNGCMATDNVLVTLDDAAPDVEAGEAKILTCSVTSIALAGSSSTEGATFSWSGPGIVSGGTTLTPTVNAAGTYILTVTALNGCTATDNVLVTLDNTAPDAEAGEAKILTCSITSIALAGSSTTEGATFLWSGPGIVSGGTTLTPTVNAEGTYILTVTATNGCTATDNVLVSTDNAVPVVNAGEDRLLNCSVNSVSLSGSTNAERALYLWSGPGIVSGANTLNPVVNVSGTYILTVTAPNGCVATDAVEVKLDTDKEPPVIICPASITVVCASAIPDPVKPEATDNCGIAKVEWIGDVKGNETCESRFTITRTYRATDVNGFTAECTQVITVYDNIAPLLKPGAVFPAGQTGMNLCKASIPAGPTVEEIKALYEDNCGGPVVVFKSGEPTGDDCSWSVTYSYIVKDMCRNYVADVPKVTFSGGDKTPPVLKPGASFPVGQTGINACKSEIPAGPTVDAIKALYTENCSNVIVVNLGGKVTGDDCSWTVTYTYRVKDACYNEILPRPTITYSGGDKTPPVLRPGASFPVGQTGINGCKSEIPAGPTVDAIKALYTENCSNVIVVNLGGKVTGDDCSWTVTYTYRVKDACYNEILPRPTITYSGGDKTPPVLRPGASFPVGQTGINGCKSEIPAGPTVDEIKTIYTDNCGGSVIVLSPDVIVTGDDKNWSVTYTYSVKDECYNEVLPRPAITYSGGDMTAPVLKPGATIPVGETGINQPMSSMPEGPSAEEIGSLYIDNCGNGIVVTKLEGKVTGDDSSWTVTYTYVITDTFNNEVLPGPSVTYSGSSKTPPTILLDNGETEYNIEGCDMEFRLPKPVVTAECNGDIDLKAYVGVTEIDIDSYRFENEGVTIVTFIATDACGNSSSATVTVNREICIDKSHCTYTQDWYGSQGSTNCVFIDGIYQKMDALSMMTEAFGDLAKVTFGNSSTNKYFELMRESISGTDGYEGIFKMLPGGGTAAALIGPANSLDPIGRTAGRWPNVPRSTELSNRGTIMNGLLSQTIALFFNLENDESLGEFELTGRYMVTAKSVDCGSEIAVPNSSSYVEFPQSVLDYFSTKNLAGNVDDLYNLANDVLGGIEKSVPASDVEKAVAAINKGFDGCRLLVEFSQSVPAVPGAPATGSVTTPAISGSNELSEVKLTVYPNPFAQVVRFEIRMVKNSHVRVDIYSHSGSLLGMILNEDLSEGDIRTVEFDGTKYPHSSFLYRITTNSTLLNGTLLKTK